MVEPLLGGTIKELTSSQRWLDKFQRYGFQGLRPSLNTVEFKFRITAVLQQVDVKNYILKILLQDKQQLRISLNVALRCDILHTDFLKIQKD